MDKIIIILISAIIFLLILLKFTKKEPFLTIVFISGIICSVCLMIISINSIVNKIIPGNTVKNIKTTYHFPKELPNSVMYQQLICNKIENTDTTRDLYFTFDNSYRIEFSSKEGQLIMSDNGRIICNFDSTTDVFKAIAEDNQ